MFYVDVSVVFFFAVAVGTVIGTDAIVVGIAFVDVGSDADRVDVDDTAVGAVLGRDG